MGRKRGFFAQLERIAREAERAQRQRQRELQRQAREQHRFDMLEAKEREKERARYEVDRARPGSRIPPSPVDAGRERRRRRSPDLRRRSE